MKKIAAIIILLFITAHLFCQKTDPVNTYTVFILKGYTKFSDGKIAEGVDIELKKDGKTITKTTSGKNGEYHLQIKGSTNNPKNEYLLHITHTGTIPKTLSINTYVPPKEFNLRSFTRYDFDLEIKLNGTAVIVKDIVLGPSGKIYWDINKHKFVFEQDAKVKKEEEKLKENSEKYLRELAEKRKKEQEEIAKKKAAAAAEAKRLADQKEKEEANRIIQQNMEAMKQEMKRKRIQDSLNNLSDMKYSIAGNLFANEENTPLKMPR